VQNRIATPCLFFQRALGLILAPNHGEWRSDMANREQRGNKEKKKPKAEKNQQMKPSSAPAYVQPELVRKPHKGKES
jgi:hypothetical protein